MAGSEETTITSEGKVTVPKRIRDELGLSPGMEVEFILEEDGTILVRRKESTLKRLQNIKDQLAERDVDIEKMRRESKTAWSSQR